MKITRLSVYRIALPIAGGYTFSKGKTVLEADTTVVRLDTDANITGWGEACPLGPFYLPSYAEGLRTGLSVLAPQILNMDPCRIGALNYQMDRELRGHPYVKSAVDVAAHDILGKVAGLPVHALLGGRQMGVALMYWSVTQGNPDDMRRAVASARRRGYRQFQLKVGGDPAEDIERIRAGMDAAAPGEIFLCDANTGWRRDEALKVAFATQDLDYILEQPCALYADNLSVRRRVRQTVKLDESLQTPEDVSKSLSDDACDVACIKITKMGGLSKARFARDLLAAHGIPMTIEDVWGAEIVTAALGHLAISTPPDAILNTTDLHSYNEVHIAAGAPASQEGELLVSDEPGLGIDPDMSALGDPVAVYQ